MIKEIYNKLPTERGYKRQLETDNEIEMIVQQIKMLIGTKEGDVLGAPGFGVNLQQFLFGFNNSVSDITNVMNNAISYFVKYDRNKYNVGVEVRFGQTSDGLSEYALIDILVNQYKVIGIFVNQE